MVLPYKIVGNESCGVSAEETAKKIKVGYAKAGDAGIDLFCCISSPVHIAVGHTALIACGIAVKVPDGRVGLIRSRSSTHRRWGLAVIEGNIDSGYTGPLFVTLYNPGLDGRKDPVVIQPWERLAQLIVVPFLNCNPIMVKNLPQTERGLAGFGSSGR